MIQFYFTKIFFIAATSLAFTGFTTCNRNTVADPGSASSLADFETRLDKLRQGSNIPGMAAGIVKDGKVSWTKNYGYENLEEKKVVTNTTIFHLASLTKTFASIVIMQLVNENKINLNAPVANYGINLVEKDTVRVIHLLTHTSEGVPGSNYKYNGSRFSLLSGVIQSATGETFHQLAAKRIMQPLGLWNTAPRDLRLAAIDGFDTISLKQNTAQGYASDGIQAVDYPKGFSTSAGLMSNLENMLKYAAAFDGNQLLTPDLKSKIFAPAISNDGKTFPYGLGWFIQQREGITITWHYGYWVGMSSLIIRIPAQNISFIIMANSDMLSAPYPLGNGDIWVSPYAKEFLKSFVLDGAKLLKWKRTNIPWSLPNS